MTTTETLTHEDARVRTLASFWHGGQWSPLYALCSSGAIVDGLFQELDDCVKGAETDADRADLEYLIDYTWTRGKRGPITGWANLPWADKPSNN